MTRPLALAVVPGEPPVVLTRGQDVALHELSPVEALALATAAQKAVRAILDAHPGVVLRSAEEAAVGAAESLVRGLFRDGLPLGGRAARRRREGR